MTFSLTYPGDVADLTLAPGDSLTITTDAGERLHLTHDGTARPLTFDDGGATAGVVHIERRAHESPDSATAPGSAPHVAD